MNLKPLNFALLCALMLCLGACGGGRDATRVLREDSRPQTGKSQPELSLPLPSALAGTARSSSATDPLRRFGAEFEAALPNTGVVAVGQGASFVGTGTSLSSSAYALYSFDSAAYTGPATIGGSWSSLPAGEFSTWLGLANFERDVWEWHNVSGGISLRLSALTDYTSAGGETLVAVVLAAAESAELTLLQIGSDSGFTETEDNDSPEQIHQFLSIDPAANFVGAIGSAPFTAWPDGDHEDWYGVNAEPGDIVTVHVFGDFETCEELRASLFDADGAEFGAPASMVSGYSASIGRAAVSADDLPLRLRIDSADGAGFSKYVIVVTLDTAANEGPIPLMTASPRNGNAPLMVNFDASDSVDNQGETPGTIVKYEWDWDGDFIFDFDSGSTPTASHEYTEDGVYRPCVRVTDDGGFVGINFYHYRFGDSAFATVTVGNAPFDEIENNDNIYDAATHSPLPALPFSGYTGNIGYGPLGLAYDGDSIDNFSFSVNSGEKWTFIADFDPLPADLATLPELILSTGGSGVTSSNSGADRCFVGFTAASSNTHYLRFACQQLRDYELSAISGLPPQVTLSIDSMDRGVIPLQVDFSAAAIDGVGALVSYEWDFDRDGVFDLNTGTTPTASHTYTESGKFWPLVRVTDAAGFYGENKTLQYVYAWPIEYDEIEDGSDSQPLSGFPISDFTGNVGSDGSYDGDAFDAFSLEDLDHGESVLIRINLTGRDEARTGVDLRDDNFSLGATLPAGDGVQELRYSVKAGDVLPITLHFNLSDSINFDPLTAEYSFDVEVPDETPVSAMTTSSLIGAVPLTVDFDASGSSDPDGIVKYEFDVEGYGEWIDNGAEPILSHTYTTAGHHIVRMRVTDASGSVSTDNPVVMVEAGSGLYDDLENNDDQPGAQAVTLPLSGFRGSLGSGPSYAGNDGDRTDFFSFSALAGQTLTAELFCDPALMSVDLSLWRGDEDALANADSSIFSNTVVLTHTFEQAGTYFLEVDGGLSKFADYLLSMSLE